MQNPTDKIKFAILGFGHIGKRHAEEIFTHEEGDIVAIVDIDKSALETAAALYPVTSLFPSLEEFFKSGLTADIINICTPNGLHITQAIQAVENGHNVLIEKPAGLYKKECENLLQLAETKGKEAFCVLQNRYSPPAQLLKRLVDENSLGKILWVEVNCYWNRDERYYKKGNWRGTLDLDGGTLYTQFSHFVDLMCWVFGGIKNINGYFTNCNHQEMIEFEDTGNFHFEFKKEGAGAFTYSTSVWGQNMESSFIVLGEKGSVKIGGQYMEKLEFFNVKDMVTPTLLQSNPSNHYGQFQGSANNHALVIDNVIKALKEKFYDLPTLKDAIESVELIEEVYNIRDGLPF